MIETMTNRQRIKAVLQGEEVDRLPVWLKMANATWKSMQPEPYRSMNGVVLLREAGCDVMSGCGLPGGALTATAPHIRTSSERVEGGRLTTIETPDGPLTQKYGVDAETNSSHPLTYFAENTEDLRKLRWVFTGTEYHVDANKAAEGFANQQRLAQDDVFTTSGVGPSPLMHLVEHMCGPEAYVYNMVDAPDVFDEVVELMHQDRLRYLRAVLPHCPADSFWISENTSTTLISPALFEKHCMPHLAAYGSLIEEHNTVAVHHMCGTLNALLEMIDTLPATANEAFTTRPLGDVSLAEGRRRMPSKALIGGTNATLWLASEDTIVRTVAEDLAQCPDRRKIFLTSAGVLPPPVSFEKAKAVVEELKRL